MWDGFWAVDVPPSPKVHDQLVTEPLDRSVKLTSSGASPPVGVPLNSAVGPAGGEPTVMYPTLVSPSEPAGPLAVSVTS